MFEMFFKNKFYLARQDYLQLIFSPLSSAPRKKDEKNYSFFVRFIKSIKHFSI